MEKTTHVNPFEEVHKKSQAARERLRQARKKDALVCETKEAAASDFREKHEPGRPRPLTRKTFEEWNSLWQTAREAAMSKERETKLDR